MHYGLKLIILCLYDAGKEAALIATGPLRSLPGDVRTQKGLRQATTEGNAGKQQGNQTDFEQVQHYLEQVEAF